ncbi:Putative membrane protein [Vibrio jasicida]|uniref:Membrane protein n=1 Tax=Vibrio jasicida TaxID=766224 RepID=A0AAU9QLP6_9VIBR|nr:Putative membrane protein [Vibrio jasicida]CAH1583759.1 Putative membrane protein [Vibrio jasicida]CAH1592618.1 Putative membrane protein [Vibrio jasicida]
MNKTLYTILGAFFGSFCAISLFMSMMLGAWWLVDFIALS